MSQDLNSSNRTSLSLIASTLLHGSVIALIAIGPTYLPQLRSGSGGNQDEINSSQISVQTIEAQTAPEIETPSQPEVAMPAPTPPPTIAPAPVIVQPTPMGVKTQRKRVIAEKPISIEKPKSALPEKVEIKRDLEPQREPLAESDVDPQPLVAVNESSQEVVDVPETIEHTEHTPISTQNEERAPLAESPTPAPIEEVAATTEEVPPPVAPIATAQAIAPTEQTAAPTTETTAPVAETTTPTEQTAAPTAQATAPSAETTASKTEALATGAPAAGANSAESTASPTAPIRVTQDVRELKQLPGNPKPNYSTEMRLKKAQGRGQVVYFVTKDGQVSSMRLTRSTGFTDLDKEAMKAFSKYKFVPGQEGYTVHDFEFSLRGPELSEAGRLRTSMNQ